jgi:hypothetical protein
MINIAKKSRRTTKTKTAINIRNNNKRNKNHKTSIKRFQKKT